MEIIQDLEKKLISLYDIYYDINYKSLDKEIRGYVNDCILDEELMHLWLTGDYYYVEK